MKFPEVAARYGLYVDISGREAERRYGRDWIELTLSGKSVLGTEGERASSTSRATLSARPGRTSNAIPPRRSRRCTTHYWSPTREISLIAS